jgi:hypothetical protein
MLQQNLFEKSASGWWEVQEVFGQVIGGSYRWREIKYQ